MRKENVLRFGRIDLKKVCGKPRRNQIKIGLEVGHVCRKRNRFENEYIISIKNNSVRGEK